MLFPRGVADPAPHLFGWVRQSNFNANLLQFRDAVARMAGVMAGHQAGLVAAGVLVPGTTALSANPACAGVGGTGANTLAYIQGPQDALGPGPAAAAKSAELAVIQAAATLVGAALAPGVDALK